MTIITAKTCANCAYMARENRQLTCRYMPLSVMPIMSAGPRGEPMVVGHVASFPPVNDAMCCGQHRPRIMTADDALEFAAAN